MCGLGAAGAGGSARPANGEVPVPRGRVHPRTVPSGSRVAVRFPDAAEDALAGVDDALIPRAQRFWGIAPLRCAFIGATTLTAIETALPWPCVLYALGCDRAAGLCTSVLGVLALTSQIPKKFIFRPRPWMTGRAKPIRKDKTSSFPSRAVACAAVFSWLTITSCAVEMSSSQLPTRVLWMSVALLSSVASISRIACGAHYPSDCVCGFLLGVGVIKGGGKLELFWRTAGSAVVTALRQGPAPYPPLSLSSSAFQWHAPAVVSGVSEVAGGNARVTSVWNLSQLWTLVPWRRLLRCVTTAYGVTIVSMAGFWVKCSYVYGLLLSAATFRYVFLSPGSTGIALGKLTEHESPAHKFKVLLWFIAILSFGMGTRGKKGYFRVVAFTFIYFASLGGIIYCRLL